MKRDESLPPCGRSYLLLTAGLPTSFKHLVQENHSRRIGGLQDAEALWEHTLIHRAPMRQEDGGGARTLLALLVGELLAAGLAVM